MGVEVQPSKTDREGSQLFGTLLDSKPARTRSPAALAVAVVLHIILIVLLVVVSRPFIPTLANKIFQVDIIIPEEESALITFERPQQQPQDRAASARAPRRATQTPGGPELTFTPGPITAIPEITPGPETVEPSDGGAGTGDGAARPSLTDRLRPGTLDPRLNPGTSYVPRDGSPAEGVRARIAQSIEQYNDSVAAETEAKRRALDWTIKSKDGKQWGIGPDGRIHLGNITLPRVAFSPPPGRRDEINALERNFNEIERQANQEIGRQSFKERVKAIRARKEREREEKKKADVAEGTN